MLGEFLVSKQHSTKIWSVKMPRRGLKTNLDGEDKYWIPNSTGIGRKTSHRSRVGGRDKLPIGGHGNAHGRP